MGPPSSCRSLSDALDLGAHRAALHSTIDHAAPTGIGHLTSEQSLRDRS
jgi:hypothetical protein